MKAFGTPLPGEPHKGTCSTMFTSLNAGFSSWTPLATYPLNKSFDDNATEYKNAYQKAQINANAGIPTIALSAWTQNDPYDKGERLNDDHVAVVTPNDGTVPSNIGQVFISQAGASCFKGKTLSYGWRQARWQYIMFWSFYG